MVAEKKAKVFYTFPKLDGCSYNGQLNRASGSGKVAARTSGKGRGSLGGLALRLV